MGDGKKKFEEVEDWGKKRLRIWKIDEDGEVMGERSGEDGMMKEKEEGFEKKIERNMERIGEKEEMKVVIWGMEG